MLNRLTPGVILLSGIILGAEAVRLLNPEPATASQTQLPLPPIFSVGAKVRGTPGNAVLLIKEVRGSWIRVTYPERPEVPEGWFFVPAFPVAFSSEH
jgi:hypothetical protein